MMRGLKFVFTFVFFVYTVSGRPNNNQEEDDYDLQISEPEPGVQNDDYEYGGDADDDLDSGSIPEPNLITQAQDIIANENDTVRLPCQLENENTLVSLWKKNNDIIFQDSIKFSPIARNFEVQNRTLIINKVTANETANYTCMIPLTNTTDLHVTHRLFVRTPPKILNLAALHDIVQLDSGSTLVLTCKAIGFPQPIIKWSRRGQLLGSKSETITIENISHHDAGDYQCLADNNIEPPAHKYIHISVVHKPIVKIEKVTVNSAPLLDTQLICNVHAIPEAVVNWKRDGVNIAQSRKKHLKHNNHTHVLEIKGVEEEDFGVYTCSATNRVGRSDKEVKLTGLPSPAEHIRTHQDIYNNVTMAWALESNLPIIEYSLEYRKHGDAAWKSLSHEIINPDGIVYTVNYTLPHLPVGQYEIRMRSKNTYGWSDYSKVVKYRSGESHHHSAQHKHQQNNNFDSSPPEERPMVVEQRQRPADVEFPAKGTAGGGAGQILPTLALLCILIATTIYSH